MGFIANCRLRGSDAHPAQTSGSRQSMEEAWSALRLDSITLAHSRRGLGSASSTFTSVGFAARHGSVTACPGKVVNLPKSAVASDRSALTAWESQKDGTLRAVQLQPGSPQSATCPQTRGLRHRQPTAANAVTPLNLPQSSPSVLTAKTTVRSAGANTVLSGQSKASSLKGWAASPDSIAALDASGLTRWRTSLKTATTEAAGEGGASSWDTWSAKLKQATAMYSNRVAEYYKPPLLKVSAPTVAPPKAGHNDAALESATALGSEGDYCEAALQAVHEPSIQDSGVFLNQTDAPGWSAWSGRVKQAVQERANGDSWQQMQLWGAHVTARMLEQVQPMVSEVTMTAKGVCGSIAASVNAATEQVGVKSDEDLQQQLAGAVPLSVGQAARHVLGLRPKADLAAARMPFL